MEAVEQEEENNKNKVNKNDNRNDFVSGSSDDDELHDGSELYFKYHKFCTVEVERFLISS